MDTDRRTIAAFFGRLGIANVEQVATFVLGPEHNRHDELISQLRTNLRRSPDAARLPNCGTIRETWGHAETPDLALHCKYEQNLDCLQAAHLPPGLARRFKHPAEFVTLVRDAVADGEVEIRTLKT